MRPSRLCDERSTGARRGTVCTLPRLKLTHEIEIGRPPADVYAYVAEPEHLPEWQADVHAIEVESPTRFRESRTFLGRHATSSVDVLVAEPGRELTLRTSGGPVAVTVRHVFVPAGDRRTRLAVTADAEVGGALRMAARMMRGAAEQRLRKDFERLKQILEA